MNQKEFLGHENLNASTVSMREVQAAQTKFWTDVYTASIRAGNTPYTSANYADSAMDVFNKRFVPRETTPAMMPGFVQGL